MTILWWLVFIRYQWSSLFSPMCLPISPFLKSFCAFSSHIKNTVCTETPTPPPSQIIITIMITMIIMPKHQPALTATTTSPRWRKPPSTTMVSSSGSRQPSSSPPVISMWVALWFPSFHCSLFSFAYLSLCFWSCLQVKQGNCLVIFWSPIFFSELLFGNVTGMLVTCFHF